MLDSSTDLSGLTYLAARFDIPDGRVGSCAGNNVPFASIRPSIVIFTSVGDFRSK
jgi:hypothetical protein